MRRSRKSLDRFTPLDRFTGEIVIVRHTILRCDLEDVKFAGGECDNAVVFPGTATDETMRILAVQQGWSLDGYMLCPDHKYWNES